MHRFVLDTAVLVLSSMVAWFLVSFTVIAVLGLDVYPWWLDILAGASSGATVYRVARWQERQNRIENNRSSQQN